MLDKIRGRIGLSLHFTFIAFLNFLLTTIIVALISYIYFVVSGYDFSTPPRTDPVTQMIILLVSCVIVGSIISFFTGAATLRTTRNFIAAMKRLSSGDFSVRINIEHPPDMRDLSRSFNVMAEELGGIELLRTDFINNFSHEFKTPIMSIKGFAEILKYDDLSDEERHEYLDIVISESARLAEIASNVLILSKVEAQTILSGSKPFDLAEQIRHCILLLESKWEAKNIAFTADMEDVTLDGNEELLSQVWINLMDNAIKFTPEGGEISVRLGTENGSAVFSIRDSGSGISEDAIPHVFDKFYQVDTSRSTKGNGLGLTLSKRIVELHGGEISCRSREGEWTEFTVILKIS